MLARLRQCTEFPDLLILFGEFEAAAADAMGDSPVLRRAAVALGRQFYRNCTGAGVTLDSFKKALAAVEGLELPRDLQVSVPEGYAFYGLYPEAYVDAARCFIAERAPRSVCVIGIRSIGASLSAVVAGALEESGCEVSAFTVRPTGHPFDRQLKLDREIPADAEYCAVVDEGPGLSGSSFICVADALPEERVVVFPSWEGDASRFVNDNARRRWPAYRKYCSSFQPRWVLGDRTFDDLSAGQWRDPGEDIAVQPHHEALKYRSSRSLYKFSGLGSYGRERFDRAQALHEAGYTPEAKTFQRGFVEFEFARGRRGTSHHRPPIARIAGYLAFRQRAFPSGRSVDFDDLLNMIEVNTGTHSGLEHYRQEFENRPAAAVDGRMMPHEWIESDGTWLKTDSVDHCCDHFYPGFADIAWDLAGAAVEFRLETREREALLEAYRANSGDRISPGLTGFYETAYRAFRLGYVTLAAQATAGTPEHARFQAAGRYYARQYASERAIA